MLTSMKRLGAVALVGLAVFSPSPLPAQYYTRVVNPLAGQGYTGINPFYRITPQLTLGQFAFNSAVLGRAISQIPPYALGYNPYPQMINYGPSYPTLSTYGGGYGGYGLNPYLSTGGYGGYGATLTTNPYGGGTLDSSGYGGGYSNPYYPYYSDPINGYLRGVADVTTANAQYRVTIERAKLLNEQVMQARTENRRRIFDEARYERLNTPTAEDQRVADQTTALNRARHDPPVTEIWSGKALDDLYRHLASEQGKGFKGPNVPLDEDVLKRINVSSGAGGNIGLLKDDAKLQWPVTLQSPEYADARRRIDQNLAEAVKQAKFNNPVEAGMITDLQAALKNLNDRLVQDVSDLSPSQYIEAKRYLNQLGESVRALSDPQAANYFTGKWAAKGKNVGELVKNMTDLGLRFAPAAPGDEAAYRALYHALASYDAGMGQVASGKP